MLAHCKPENYLNIKWLRHSCIIIKCSININITSHGSEMPRTHWLHLTCLLIMSYIYIFCQQEFYNQLAVIAELRIYMCMCVCHCVWALVLPISCCSHPHNSFLNGTYIIIIIIMYYIYNACFNTCIRYSNGLIHTCVIRAVRYWLDIK